MLTIRPVAKPDFSAIAALTNHYIRETAIHFGTEPVQPDELCADWLAAKHRYPYLVAEDEAGFCGYAKATSFRARAAYAQTAEIGVYIAPAHQRSGVGRELVSRLIESCAQRGFHVLIAGVALPNEGSVRLCESLGFRYVGVFPEIGRKFDRWHDVAFWQLSLTSG